MIPAIIPVMGGSRRLKDKNKLGFCGHPLMAWTVTQAKCSHLIDRVYVTTNDEELAEIGEKYGADIIWRPEPESDRKLTPGTAYMHAVKQIEKAYDFDTFIPITVTAPVRMPYDIDRSIELYRKLKSRELVPLYNPRETVIYAKEGCKAECVIFNKTYDYLTQGGVWTVLDKEMWKKKMVTRADENADLSLETNPEQLRYDFYPIKWWQQYDIDDIDDFEQCEILMERYILKGRGAAVYEEYAERR